MFAFDLDGTLVDNKKAVKRSYEKAGVTPPEDFWGKPSKEWLRDPSATYRKNRIYTEIAPLLNIPLPTLDIYLANYPSPIITGASQDGAVTTLKSCLVPFDPTLLYTGCTAEDKADILNNLSEKGTYYDDRKLVVEFLRENTSWRIVHVE